MLGEKIKLIRTNAGLNQEQFGELIGSPAVSGSTVSEWENNNNRPTDFHLERIGIFVGLTVEQLMEGVKNG